MWVAIVTMRERWERGKAPRPMLPWGSWEAQGAASPLFARLLPSSGLTRVEKASEQPPCYVLPSCRHIHLPR